MVETEDIMTASPASSKAEEIMAEVREVLATCCSETRRLLPDDVLEVPAVQHMLHKFLLETSRPFEDWVMEPRCRHVLSKLRDRIDSADGPAVSANYEEQCALVAHERMRTNPAGAGGGSGGRAADNGRWGTVDGGGEGWGGGGAAATTVLSATSRGFPDAAAGEDVGLGNGGGGGAGGGGGGGGGDEEANGTRTEKEQEGGCPVTATGVAPAASPWSSAGVTTVAAPPPPPFPSQGVSQNVLRVGAGGGGGGGGVEEGGEGSEMAIEDTYDVLMVLSEATKEEAKERFLQGDYMGAAKKYFLAAETLDERPLPTHPRLGGLRGRLKDLYLSCMCNAAVAGFKAAKAAPAPGEAHGLVVDACSKALARGGGKCPKARFWRARVKICQRMYEAAADDLSKAVEEEQEQQDDEEKDQEQDDKGKEAGEDKQGTEAEEPREGQKERISVAQDQQPKANKCCEDAAKEGETAHSDGESGGESVGGALDGTTIPPTNSATGVSCRQTPTPAPNGKPAPVIGPAATPTGAPSPPGETDSAAASNGAWAISGGASAHPNAAPAVLSTAASTAGGGCDGHNNTSSPVAAGPSPPPTGTGNSSSINASGHGGECVGHDAGASLAKGGGKAQKASEAMRWLGRVRAKLAEMDAARAQAAEQASKREEKAAAGNQRALELAQRRARHGPGHVPRRGTPPAEEGQGAVEGQDGTGALPGGDGGGGTEGEGGEGADGGDNGGDDDDDDRLVWKVPRPPPLKVEKRSPAMVLNDYSMQAKFQVIPEFEQVTGDEGQPEYVCSISVGPEDRVVGKGRGSNMKAAKQQASRELLTNAALAWNEENPEDTIDMDTMVPLPTTASSASKPRPPPAEITEEFKAYCKAWVDKVVAEDVHEACFSDDIDKHQRKYVHSVVEELRNPAVLSKSATVKGRRRLSVMRRTMMEGLAFMSGDNVIVVDVPPPPTHPDDVEDLASITRPPPERKVAAAAPSASTEEETTATATTPTGDGTTPTAQAASTEKETTATATASASASATTATSEQKEVRKDGGDGGGGRGPVTAASAVGAQLTEEGVRAAAVEC
eukprot:g3268.t1